MGNHGPTAEQILEIATIEGPRVLGREDDIGSLEAGKSCRYCPSGLGSTGLCRRSERSCGLHRTQRGQPYGSIQSLSMVRLSLRKGI